MVLLAVFFPAHAQAPIFPVITLESGKDNLKPYLYTPLEARIVALESSYKVDAVGDHGLAYGPAQFHEATFNWLKKKSRFYWLDYHNAADQLLLLNWALNNGYCHQWSTCSAGEKSV